MHPDSHPHGSGGGTHSCLVTSCHPGPESHLCVHRSLRPHRILCQSLLSFQWLIFSFPPKT